MERASKTSVRGTRSLGESLLSFEGVGFRYDASREVVSDVNLDVREGGFYFLTGFSGAGKTTLLRLMYTVFRPTRGLMRLFGQEMATFPTNQLPYLRRRIGGMFEDLPLINRMNVFENVALPLRFRGLPDSLLEHDVFEILSWVQLTDYVKRFPSELSAGQRQRVAMARAVVPKPELFLADEPTANVDERMARRLLYLIESLNQMGATVIMATHNQDLVRRLSKAKIFHISSGRLQLHEDYKTLPKDFWVEEGRKRGH